MKKIGTLMILTLLLVFAMSLTPASSEAQVYQKTEWLDSVTTAVDTLILQTSIANVTVTVINHSTTGGLYCWCDASGSSTALDTNKFIYVPPASHIKFTGAVQKMYFKSSTGKLQRQVIIGNFEYNSLWNDSPSLFTSNESPGRFRAQNDLWLSDNKILTGVKYKQLKYPLRG